MSKLSDIAAFVLHDEVLTRMLPAPPHAKEVLSVLGEADTWEHACRLLKERHGITLSASRISQVAHSIQRRLAWWANSVLRTERHLKRIEEAKAPPNCTPIDLEEVKALKNGRKCYDELQYIHPKVVYWEDFARWWMWSDRPKRTAPVHLQRLWELCKTKVNQDWLYGK